MSSAAGVHPSLVVIPIRRNVSASALRSMINTDGLTADIMLFQKNESLHSETGVLKMELKEESVAALVSDGVKARTFFDGLNRLNFANRVDVVWPDANDLRRLSKLSSPLLTQEEAGIYVLDILV